MMSQAVLTLPTISRESYGTVFARSGEIQNAGAFWTTYLTFDHVPDDLIPNEVKQEINPDRLCYLGSQEPSETNSSHLQVWDTLSRICDAHKPVVVKFHNQKMKIIKEIETLQRQIKQLGTDRTKGRRERAAPLDFVSTAGRSLFGFAKHSQLITVATMLLKLQQHTNQTISQMMRNQDYLEAAFRVQDDRLNMTRHSIVAQQQVINRLVSAMSALQRHYQRQTQQQISNTQSIHEILILQNKLVANIQKGVIAQTTALQTVYQEVRSYHQSMEILIRGGLPVALMPPGKMEELLDQIRISLMMTHPGYDVAVSDIQYYYANPIEVVKISDRLVGILRVPLTAGYSTTFDIYETATIRVPVGPNVNASTKITGLKQYFAMSKNKEYYLEMDAFQMGHCLGEER
jgi:hypothetical protein